MGKYDQFLVGLPESSSRSGKYDAFTKDLPNSPSYAEQLEPGIYGETSPTGQRILENLGRVAGGYGVGALAGTGLVKAAESNLGKALLNSPKALGKQYAAQDVAVGVARDIPETATRANFESPYTNPISTKPPRAIPVKTAFKSNLVGAEPLPTNIPTELPDSLAGFKRFATKRIDTFGDKLSPQELMNYKVHLETKMADGSIPKFSQEGKPTTAYQQASDLRNKIAQTFKKVMDTNLQGKELPAGVMKTRTALDKVNTLSNSIRSIPGKVKSAAKTTAKVGALGGGTYGLYKLLNQ